MKLAMESSMLALESQQVIGLRLMKMSLGGPAATHEVNRMVEEKMTAFGEAAVNAVTGGSARSVVRNYRRKVRANRRRLAGA